MRQVALVNVALSEQSVRPPGRLEACPAAVTIGHRRAGSHVSRETGTNRSGIIETIAVILH